MTLISQHQVKKIPRKKVVRFHLKEFLSKIFNSQKCVLGSILYSEAKNYISECVQGEYRYDVKRKIKSLLRENHTCIPISTIAEIENSARYYYVMMLKSKALGYRLTRLHCKHDVIWIQKTHLEACKKIVKHKDKNGSLIIYCKFRKDSKYNNGVLKLYSFVAKLNVMLEHSVKRFDTQCKNFLECMDKAKNPFIKLQQKAQGMLNDACILPFAKALYEKLHGTAETKIVKKSARKPIRRAGNAQGKITPIFTLRYWNEDGSFHMRYLKTDRIVCHNVAKRAISLSFEEAKKT